jgi:hypothetical protein
MTCVAIFAVNNSIHKSMTLIFKLNYKKRNRITVFIENFSLAYKYLYLLFYLLI